MSALLLGLVVNTEAVRGEPKDRPAEADVAASSVNSLQTPGETVLRRLEGLVMEAHAFVKQRVPEAGQGFVQSPRAMLSVPVAIMALTAFAGLIYNFCREMLARVRNVKMVADLAEDAFLQQRLIQERRSKSKESAKAEKRVSYRSQKESRDQRPALAASIEVKQQDSAPAKVKDTKDHQTGVSNDEKVEVNAQSVESK